MHLGHDVDAIDDNSLGLGRAQGSVKDGALFRDVDPIAAEHRGYALMQAAFAGERQEQSKGLVRDAVLRVVEVNTQLTILNRDSKLFDILLGVSSSTGAADAFKPVVLDANGVLDPNLTFTAVSAIAFELLVPGSLVNLYDDGGTLTARLASAEAGPGQYLASGFVLNSYDPASTAVVALTGRFVYSDSIAEFVAGDIGSAVYLSAATPGHITKTIPSGPGEIEQFIGYVVGFTAGATNLVTVAFGVGVRQFSQLSGVCQITQGGTSATTALGARQNITGVNVQSGTTYAFVEDDFGRHTIFTGFPQVFATIPTAGDPGFGEGFYAYVVSTGAPVLITPDSGFFNGSDFSYFVDSGQVGFIYVSGGNWFGYQIESNQTIFDPATGVYPSLSRSDRKVSWAHQANSVLDLDLSTDSVVYRIGYVTLTAGVASFNIPANTYPGGELTGNAVTIVGCKTAGLNGTFVVADSANNVIHVNIAIGDIVFEQEDGDATISVAINNCQSTDGPTDGILSLTTEQNYNTVYRFAASTPLAGPVTIVFGSGHEDVWWNGFGPFLVENNTTQDIVAASNTPSGSPITVPAGEQRWFYFQGTGLQTTTLHQIPVASVGGADTQLQFNQSGSLGGSPNLQFDYTNNILTIGGGNPSGFDYGTGIYYDETADTGSGSFAGLDLATNVNVAASPSTNDWYGVNQVLNFTGSINYSGSLFGFKQLIRSNTSGGVGSVVGLIGFHQTVQTAGLGSTPDGNVTGFYSNVIGNSVAGQTVIAGFSAAMSAETDCTTSYGFETSFGGGAGNVSSVAGMFIGSPGFAAGIASHLYGIYIDNQTTGGVNNPDPWAIFVAGGVSKFRGVATNLVAKTGAYGITADDYTVTCDGTFPVTLPITDIKDGQIFVIKNIGTGTITISCANNIDGFNTFVSSTQFESITVQWDATANQYWII